MEVSMYRHILVPLDGSRLAEQVIPHAKSFAQLDPKVQITLLRAVPAELSPAVEFSGMYSYGMTEADDMQRAVSAAQDYLNALAMVIRSEGFHMKTHVSQLEAAEAILAFVEEHQVDLIAIATHGRSGLSRWIFGSVTQKVIQAASVPVLVIRPKQP
jgi:nucleotide-binding universal stress UspA family protein